MDKIKQTERLLKRYFNGSLKTEIQNRRLNAEFPRRDDSNPTKVQTSMKGGSPQESLYERLEADRRLHVLERKADIITDYLEYLKQIEGGIGYKILTQYYYEKKTWQEVGQNLGYSLKPIRDRRNEMLAELTERMATLD